MAEQLLEKLESFRGARDAEGVSGAAHDLAQLEDIQEALGTAIESVSTLLEEFRTSGQKVEQGRVLVALSELYVAQDRSSFAVRHAEEALDILKSTKQARAVANALDVLFKAHLAQENPNAGLKAANKELDSARDAGDELMEVNVLVTIAHAHALLGEPLSAINASNKALDIHRRLEDKEGEGSAWHTISEMRWALGEMPEASEAARESLAAFKVAKCSWGEEKAKATISSLCAKRGHFEKAPNRPNAIKALKELVQAVENKDVQALKSAEERLNEVRDLIRDRELVDRLAPVLRKDPSYMTFLRENGWNFGDTGCFDGTYFRQYPHEAFYLNTILGGMNFGPQFRSVYPYRKGRRPEEYVAVEVAQLPETEAWQMELGFRGGIIDSCIQNMGIIHYP